MSENRVLLLEGNHRLRIDKGRLAISRQDEPATFVAPSDISSLVIDSGQLMLSSAVLRVLAKCGVSVVVTDDKHMPLSMFPGTTGRHKLVGRLEAQFKLVGSKRAGKLWMSVVRSRIQGQSFLLETFQRPGGALLNRLSRSVRSGDPSNVEAQAARQFWGSIFGNRLVRQKPNAEDPVNSALNYGYSILRSIVAKNITASGLNSVLGIGHRNESNPFNLADDLMEPYRYAVERKAVELSNEGELDEFTSATRLTMAGVVADEVRHRDFSSRLPHSIEHLVQGFLAVVDGRADSIDPFLPEHSVSGR